MIWILFTVIFFLYFLVSMKLSIIKSPFVLVGTTWKYVCSMPNNKPLKRFDFSPSIFFFFEKRKNILFLFRLSPWKSKYKRTYVDEVEWWLVSVKWLCINKLRNYEWLLAINYVMCYDPKCPTLVKCKLNHMFISS